MNQVFRFDPRASKIDGHSMKDSISLHVLDNLIRRLCYAENSVQFKAFPLNKGIYNVLKIVTGIMLEVVMPGRRLPLRPQGA